jgi:hypothetical protein
MAFSDLFALYAIRLAEDAQLVVVGEQILLFSR